MVAKTTDERRIDQLQSILDSRAALVIGHPGHELIVHGWLELARPLVFVFTDGSGRTNRSRIDLTTRILEQSGSKPGSIYGRLTDQAAYSAMLDREFDLFIQLACELAETIIADRISYIVGDAAEGYNPMHDVCRYIINTALEIASRDTGHSYGNFEFQLRSPGLDQEAPRANDIYLELDEAALARKIVAAKGYAALIEEASTSLSQTSPDVFKTECLCRVDSNLDFHGRHGNQPFYEGHGEKQVGLGYYQQVIRYHEHLEPLARALSQHAKRAARIQEIETRPGAASVKTLLS